MKKIVILILIFIVAAVVGGIVLTRNESNQASVSKSEQVKTFASIKQDIQNGGVLLDVRTPEEYAAGHIEGATLLSLQDIQSGAVPKVNKEKRVYVYCQSGNRSAQATEILEKAGYTVEDLGGIAEVVRLGGKVI